MTTRPQSQPHSINFQSDTFPPSPPGSFRLFRLLALYPVPQIELRTFSYPESIFNTTTQHPSPANTPYSYSNDDRTSTCPKYDAISYTWNSNTEIDSVESGSHTYPNDVDPGIAVTTPVITANQLVLVHTISGQLTINITSHLLSGLCTAQELHRPTWLFVDAICIDQTDPRDKATHVAGMDRVFKGAERVFVWLGLDLQPIDRSGMELANSGDGIDADVDVNLGLGACLDRVPGLVNTLELYLSTQPKPKGKGKAPERDPEAAQVPKLPPKYHSLWPALERLRLNPWFQRLWVIQEVTISREPILLYGRHSLPWSLYAKLTALCERIIANRVLENHSTEIVNQLYYVYNSRASAITKLQEHVSHNQATNVSDSGYGAGDDLDTIEVPRILINLIRKSKTSLQLDRIYGILGVLSDRMRDSIRVDYSPEMTRKYWIKWIEFFQAMLLLEPKSAERLLSDASLLDRHPNLPSWCPNLADGGVAISLVGSIPTSAGMPGGNRWAVHDDTRTVSVIPGTTNISVLGLAIDEIVHIVDLGWIKDTPRWSRLFLDSETDVDSDVAREVLVMLWKCLDNMTLQGVPLADADAILARCLVVNDYRNQSTDLLQIPNDYIQFARYLEHYTYGANASAPLNKATKSTALRFGNRFQRLARKHAFFVTKNGRSGLCSNKAKEGDILCVFMNFQLPFVLRRQVSDIFYQLVGEAYVDGMMHGEAFTGRDMSQEMPEEFIVC